MGLAMELVLVGHAATGQPNAFSPDQVKLPRVKVPHKVYSFRDKNALAKFLQQPSAYADKWVAQQGLGGANADLSTKEIWVCAISDGRNADDRASGGFYSVTLENTSGVKWKATVKASFDVAMVQGLIDLVLFIYRDESALASSSVPYGHQSISSPGTYELTIPSFDIEPNHKYYARAYINSYPPRDQAAAAKATIPEIKWTVEF
jgi:hypothetical protein